MDQSETFGRRAIVAALALSLLEQDDSASARDRYAHQLPEGHPLLE
jgi:hypothetical protein